MKVLSKKFEENIANKNFSPDAAQREIVEVLSVLQTDLMHEYSRPLNFLSSKIKLSNFNKKIDGVYIWGEVGRGKTYLMDLFFETLPFDQKMRLHFHRLMHKVHEELKLFSGKADPIKHVARKISKNAKVMCIDEFFVNDIGDAMILATLLEELFNQKVCLVITSNVQPNSLYANGLQRQNFLPAIKILESNCKIVKLRSQMDYRLRELEKNLVFFSPSNELSDRKMEDIFDNLLNPSESSFTSCELNIQGRKILAYRSSNNIVWFLFEDICEGPRSQNDYIQISREFHTVMVSKIPELTVASEGAARRFISMVDEFYDRNVKLIIASNSPIENIYKGIQLIFEFERTKSRLIEMQSVEYLSRSHIP